jgi:ribonucleoside-diphosphate reductase alpha chain
MFSIRKDWYIRNKIFWDEDYWQEYARDLAISLAKMEWMPPGRGLWAMGTPYVYERGAMALYNCAFTLLESERLDEDLHWMMDTLMNGVGDGFNPIRDDLKVYPSVIGEDFIIPDRREGWCDALKYKIRSRIQPNTKSPNNIFDLIRKKGEPINGFGGVASGPEALMELLINVDEQFNMYQDGAIDVVELKTNLANLVGCCVVAGNVRRSAEIGIAPISDPTFIDLKNYEMFPHRKAYGWMSNNSVILKSDADFERISEIAERVAINGEPGYINAKNMPLGRIGKDDGLRLDKAIGFNPCGEIPLENKEVCNLAETLPTMCDSEEAWLNASEYACLYSSTVSLLPTHRAETNRVIARNRRIGVSIIDIQNWKSEIGVTGLTKMLRLGYHRVRETNQRVNAEAGVPEAIRVTTVKPGGTTPKLPGKVSGAGSPTFTYTLRAVRVAKNSPIFKVIVESGVEWEDCINQPTETAVCYFPIHQKGKPATEVSLWEQATNLVLIQREWADNAVSNTLYFNPETELEHIEPVLAFIAPLTKSVSLLPHTLEGAYAQMPEAGITEEEYHKRLAVLKDIDWSRLAGSDGLDTRYCEGGVCDITR